MVEDNEVINRSNDLGQNLAESKKSKNHQNFAKPRKLNHHPKLFKSKKSILDKSEILVNLTMTINIDATRYLTSKARVIFTQLRQAFIKALIF